MNILIENVLHNGKKVNVHIVDNSINAIGHETYSADIFIDGSNKAIFPSLANAHTHSAMSLFRGYGDDMILQQWLEEKIWPAEAKLTEEDVYWGTKLACLEMIKSGTTLFNDMYWHFHGTAKAVEEMGIRAVISAVLIDFFDKENAKKQIDENRKLLEESKKYSSRITFALGPHAIYTVSGETLKWAYEFAEKEDLLIHLHLSETEKEVLDCKKQYNMLPAQYLEHVGCIGERLIACHCVWLEQEEIEIFKKYGVKVVHNPISNLKLAVGKFFPYKQIQEMEIPVCIGTDGCASNNNLDIFEEIKFASLLQKHENNDPTMLPCQDAWKLITKNPYEILRINGGEIKEGKLADLILVDLDNVQMIPNHNIVSNLIYSSNGSIIDTVICNGKIVMQNREIPGEEEIKRKGAEVALKIGNL